MKRLLVPLFFVLLLAGCGKAPVLPSGHLSVTGTIERVGLSLDRRGTHVIKRDGLDVYFLESTIVNLSAHEGLQVTVQGRLEPNTDAAALPVLIVERVTGGVEETLTRVSVPGLRLTLMVPDTWKLRATGELAQFTGSGSAGASPRTMLTIFPQPIAAIPFDSGSGSVTPREGLTVTPFLVGSFRAVRLFDASTLVERLAIDRGDGPWIAQGKRVLMLQFAPLSGPQDDRARALIETIERSVQVAENAGASSSAQGESSSSVEPADGIDGMPCGGAAGILCPAGYYCAVTQTGMDSGRCRRF